MKTLRESILSKGYDGSEMPSLDFPGASELLKILKSLKMKKQNYPVFEGYVKINDPGGKGFDALWNWFDKHSTKTGINTKENEKLYYDEDNCTAMWGAQKTNTHYMQIAYGRAIQDYAEYSFQKNADKTETTIAILRVTHITNYDHKFTYPKAIKLLKWYMDHS